MSATDPTAGERQYCPIHWGQFCRCTDSPAEPDAGDEGARAMRKRGDFDADGLVTPEAECEVEVR